VAIARAAAILYAVLVVGVAGFQVALAAGAPWGAYAMGGAAPGQLPTAMRVSAIFQAVLLAGMAMVILARAGLALPALARRSRRLVWLVVALTAMSLFLNLISTSAGERALWAPVLSLLLVCSLIVALSGSSAA
jgi:hypothetical protein